MSQLLHDVRVVDFGIVTAGGGATQLLADFGADVIKIEPPHNPDLFRLWTSESGSVGDSADLDGPLFRTVARNKRGIAVDVKRPEGLEVVLRLVAVSDLVVENYRRGVLARLGLNFEALTAAQPRIVLLSIGSQGETGPESTYGSFGSSLDALGGLMSITGYDAQSPMWSSNKVNFPDQIVSLLAPGLAVAAVGRAKASGRPEWIDLAQREVVTSLLGEHVLATSLSGIDPVPSGNAGLRGRQWCSRCAGQNDWVAITLDKRDEWERLARVVGAADLPPDGEWPARSAGAWDEFRTCVHDWTSTRPKREVMSVLQRAGVSAAAVMSGGELLDDPYLNEIGFFRPVNLPRGGTERQRSWPLRLVGLVSADGPSIRRRAPHVGEHTAEILTEVLGYSDREVARLFDLEVVGGFTPTTSATP